MRRRLRAWRLRRAVDRRDDLQAAIWHARWHDPAPSEWRRAHERLVALNQRVAKLGGSR